MLKIYLQAYWTVVTIDECIFNFVYAGVARLSVMGNTHDTEIARIEADFIKTKYRSQGDYRWGYTGDRGNLALSQNG